MDKFEEYLHRHKASLDVDSPADDTWQQVEAKFQAESNPAGETKRPVLPAMSRIPMIRYAVAASLIVLAGAGLWLIVRNKPANATAANPTVVNSTAANPTAANPAASTNSTAASTNPNPIANDTASASTKSTPAATASATTPNPKNANTSAASTSAASTAAASTAAASTAAASTATANTSAASTSAASTAAASTNTASTNTARTTPKKTNHRRSKTSDEVQLIDKTYATLITNQLKKLRSTPLYAENSNYFSFYVDQFKQMDHDEKTVRDDIKKYGLTNEILEQLINVYQQKLNLLKNLQTEVNKMNNKVRERQAKPGKPEAHYLNI